MPVQPRHVPVLQVRAIGQPDRVQAVLTAATQTAEQVLGPHITCRTQTRSAGRIGYVRAYLTITRKEPPLDHHDN